MLGLILDTSTDSSLIALSKNHQLIDFRSLPHEQNLSRNLLPAIAQLLLENKISLKDLFKISVGIGPGSYTGTRIAVSVAESLALALSIPLYSFCSLLAFLPQTLPQGPFAFLVGSSHATWFLLKGYLQEGLIQSPCSHHILSKEEVLPFLEDVPSLLSFPHLNLEDHIPSSSLKTAQIFQGKPNFSLLISHLAEIEQLAPQKPTILYLHQL
jgi:tRNA threonylcarbamoyl adenosine modification protein YeaZ